MAQQTRFSMPTAQLPRSSDFSWRTIAPHPQAGRTFLFARYALVHALRSLGVKPGDRVLVPAYICRVVVDAIEGFGAKVEHYALSRNLAVHESDLRTRWAGAKAVLVVHYFGFPQQLDSIRQLCNQQGVALIEDCAHVLPNPESSLGRIGDVSLFSWRKFLPVFNGAELRCNRENLQFEPARSGVGWGYALRETKSTLEQSMSFFNLVAAASSLASTDFHTAQSTADLRPDVNSNDFDLDLTVLSSSRLARTLFLHTNFRRVESLRRANYMRLRDLVADVPGVELLFGELPDGVCPYMLPARSLNRSGLHKDLRERGIPATAWDGVRPVSLRSGEFVEADKMYDDIFFLPVHQSLSEENLQAIGSALKTVTQRSMGFAGAKRA